MIDEKLVIVLFSGGVIGITIFFLWFNFWLESIIGGMRDE
jgi:hypothetical protein